MAMEQRHMLYGGAMATVLPPGAKDASTVRQIPDNQEVFTHAATDQSIIIEILEYVDKDDNAAIKTHFADLAEGNGVSEEDGTIVQTEAIPADKLAMVQCDSAWYILGQQNIAKFKEAAKNTVNIHMGLFRLARYTSDILITFNDPVFIHQDSSSSNSIPVNADCWTVDHFRQVLTSLTILDPGLFGGE